MNAQVKKFTIVKCLGEGNYSEVFEVISTHAMNATESYAMKRFNLVNKESLHCAQREFRILKRIANTRSRSNFLTTIFYSTFLYGSPLFFLTKGSGFNLTHLLNCYRCLRVPIAKFYLSEVICGLEQLHSCGIVHLDIKPDNILISNSGHVLITDFDCAFDMAFYNGHSRSDDFRGTYLYIAPEILTRRQISYKADIFSLGITMAQLVMGRVPLYDKEGDTDPVTFKWIFGIPQHLMLLLRMFLHACIAFEPDDRPNIEEVKRFALFSDVNWDAEALLQRNPPYSILDIRSNMEELEDNISNSSDYPIVLRPDSRRSYNPDDDNSVTLRRRLRQTVSMLYNFNAAPCVATLSPSEIEDLQTTFEFVNEMAF